MNKDIYPFQNIEGDFIYIFISEGIHGEILKVVLITPLPDDLGNDFKPQYNLGFGDLFDIGEGWIVNDAVRSGNGDMPKVIATVAKIGMEFLDKHPGATLSFVGYVDQKSALQGKNHRNILYQRGINSNWSELSIQYNFWGVKEGRIERYVAGRQYDRILIKHK